MTNKNLIAQSGTVTLTVGGQSVDNAFHLIGNDEDSASLAIAWGLRSSARLLAAFLQAVIGTVPDLQAVSIRIHRYEAFGGITDIEIEAPGRVHAIVEAKRGWILPSIDQLRKYALRPSFVSSSARVKRLVTLSEATEVFAAAHYGIQRLEHIPLTHVSWRSFARWCRDALVRAKLQERRLLLDLREYLESLMSSQRQDSNLVYVVSLGSGIREGWRIPWIDIVAKYHRYFHPLDKGWPKEPPNYLGFRYDGRLQSIHHVESYEVVTNLSKACPGIPRETRPPHFLYSLGKAIVPGRVVKTGSIYPNGKVWCALDALLTSPTVSHARDVTKKRRRLIEQ